MHFYAKSALHMHRQRGIQFKRSNALLGQSIRKENVLNEHRLMRWLRPSNWIYQTQITTFVAVVGHWLLLANVKPSRKGLWFACKAHWAKESNAIWPHSCALRPTTMNQNKKKKQKNAILVVRKRQWALLRYSRFPHYFINVLLAAMWNPHHNRSNEILMCVSCVSDVLFVYDLYFFLFGSSWFECNFFRISCGSACLVPHLNAHCSTIA